MKMVSLGAQAILTSERCYDSCFVFMASKRKTLSYTISSHPGLSCLYTFHAWYTCHFWDLKMSQPKVRRQQITLALSTKLCIVLGHRCSKRVISYSTCAGEHIDIAESINKNMYNLGQTLKNFYSSVYPKLETKEYKTTALLIQKAFPRIQRQWAV